MDLVTMYEDELSVFSDALSNHSNITYELLDCSDQYAGPGLLRSPYFRAFVTVMYSAIFFVALIGNGAVCFIVRAFPRMRTVTNYFIANLALGDILMSVFGVPFSFVPQLLLNNWPFGAVMCRLVNYSQVVSVLVSAYTLVALAADRYRTIMAPLRPRLTKLKAKAAIAAVWIGALGTALPIVLVTALIVPTDWHEKCNMRICQENWPHNEQFYYYSMAMMMLQFAIPLTVLVFTYARIAVAVWGGRPPGEAENSRDERMAKSKRKMIKMMVTVVIVFIVCWLPFNLLIIMWTLDIADSSWNTWPPLPYVWFAFHWLAMSHSCYNPIIYCYMSARFRYSFIQVAAKIPCLRHCLGEAVERAQRADLHNGVSGVGMTKTTLHRVNTCSSYVSIRKRVPRCSCSPARSNCSPARSTCSHTRSTCSSNLTAPSSGKGIESPCLFKKGACVSHNQNSLSPLINVCSSEACINKIDSDNSEIMLDGDSYSEGFNNSRNRISRNNGCTERTRESPARAASLLTTQGTICSNDRRHVTYMEDQI